MTLLRRARSLVPLPITTSPAPVLAGPPIDVCAGDVSPRNEPRTHTPPLVEVDLRDSDADLEFTDDGRPAVDRGECYHDLHFEFDGRRFGALVHPHQHSASLLPCPYVGKAGR